MTERITIDEGSYKQQTWRKRKILVQPTKNKNLRQTNLLIYDFCTQNPILEPLVPLRINNNECSVNMKWNYTVQNNISPSERLI